MPRNRTRYEPHPNPRYADRIRLIYERRGEDDPWIEAQVRIGGMWSAVFALKTKLRDVALTNAIEELVRREQLHAGGQPQPARAPKARSAAKRTETFEAVAEEVLEELKAERDDLQRRNGRGCGKANTLAVHISTIEERLIPAFRGVPVADLTRAQVNEWARAQKVRARRGADKGKLVKPGQSTIGSWSHSLQKVLDRAVLKELIKEDNKPTISQKGFTKAQRNPHIGRPEVEALRDHMTDA